MASRTRRASEEAAAAQLRSRDALTDEIQQQIQSLYASNDMDGLFAEARSLAEKLRLLRQHVEKLASCQESLAAKLTALTAPEHYAATITSVENNGSLTAEVAGLAQGRVSLAVSPDVRPEQLQVGATAIVARERNCLLRVASATGRWSDVGTFEQYLDPPHRIMLRDREALVAVDLADRLRDTPLKKGDLIGYDRELAGIAHEVLQTPKSDHLFDEHVSDDFAQLGGLDRQIACIKRHIDFRLRHPQLATKYALKSKCGILLKGVPGNGKTRIARCCAGYVRRLFPDRPCRFMHVAGASDYSMWLGETERKLVERFQAVREAAAEGLVVMFFDEVDALAQHRGTNHGSGAPDRILNTFLSQIDGVVPLANVVILFATNRPDMLDPGLLRPGRADEKIEIPSPNRRATQAILHCYLGRGLPLAAPHASPDELVSPLVTRLFAPNAEYGEVARVKLSDGRLLPVAGRQLLSGAMLENAVEKASQQAAVREAETGQEGLTAGDLDLALESELLSAVSLLSAGNAKSYLNSIPQDAQPIAVEPLLTAPLSAYVR